MRRHVLVETRNGRFAQSRPVAQDTRPKRLYSRPGTTAMLATTIVSVNGKSVSRKEKGPASGHFLRRFTALSGLPETGRPPGPDTCGAPRGRGMQLAPRPRVAERGDPRPVETLPRMRRRVPGPETRRQNARRCTAPSDPGNAVLGREGRPDAERTCSTGCPSGRKELKT